MTDEEYMRRIEHDWVLVETSTELDFFDEVNVFEDGNDD
jgi:hypothetical protein